ncbi:hypothetical protein [Asticcacaulis machinosus]|uniref:Uncharacterized protein n=1 Tax=Asticcacaulis machinosus TaxID=2984211 RepID=A0ABT5HEN5_9CAUL|nr:hypothetical protein [Asticcacaulis machinosus]MDC7674716.1 hypothetical protein [Asticcacaulis machinosus]
MRQSILKLAAIAAIAASLSGCIIIAKDSDPKLTSAQSATR